MKASFEIFDHTADLGIRAWGDSPQALVKPMIEGLYAAIGELVTGTLSGDREIVVEGDDRATLLRDLLSELLYLFEDERIVVTNASVLEFSERRLMVDLSVAHVDESRSDMQREVKAVTYHELALRECGDGWEAVVVVDI